MGSYDYRNQAAPVRGNANVGGIAALAHSPKMVKRFEEVLKERAPQFLAGVISACNANDALLRAEPTSVLSCAMVAASLDLDVIPSLGFAYLVPYKKNGVPICQFQIGAKGLIQLALRTGRYRTINVGEIYEDEFDGYDIISGEVRFHNVSNGFRTQGRADKIVGFFAYIEMLDSVGNPGFRKVEYWDIAKVRKHAERYSKSYQTGPWKDNFEAMAKKTVLKSLLGRYGQLSVDMRRAIVSDQASFKDFDSNPEYDDSISLDAPAEPVKKIEEEQKEEVAEPVKEESLDSLLDVEF